MNVAERLLRVFDEHAQSVAIVDSRGRATTYHDLLGHIQRLRSAIRAADLQRGSGVILQTVRGVDFSAAAVALLLEDCVPVGIHA